jgi:hypothetical protein
MPAVRYVLRTLIHALRRFSLGLAVRVVCVLAFAAITAATLLSYRFPIAFGFTWHDVYALKFDGGAIQYWHGQNRRADHTSAESVNEPSLPWSSPMIGVPDHVGFVEAEDPIGTVRRFHLTSPKWPPFLLAEGVGTMFAQPVDASGKKTELYLGRWLLARSASSWLFVVALAVPSAWIVTDAVRRLRRKEGHCVECGYDLRASGDRCPECGTLRADAEPQTAAPLHDQRS